MTYAISTADRVLFPDYPAEVKATTLPNMPADDYASASTGGALRLKGAKVKKNKKKKAGKSDLEKNLSTGSGGGESSSASKLTKEASEDNDGQQAQNTASPPPQRRKTEAERRFDEARRKKLLEMAEEAKARPQLLKTHKERVEELNTYLSKLSEHHDMPKIGPG